MHSWGTRWGMERGKRGREGGRELSNEKDNMLIEVITRQPLTPCQVLSKWKMIFWKGSLEIWSLLGF